MTEKTTPSNKAAHLKAYGFQPGQSGNPAGRPRGARVKLGEAFLYALLDDFNAHGAQAIITMREESPKDYCKVIAATLPKELNVKVDEVNELSDEQLAGRLAAVASQLARAGIEIGIGAAEAEAPKSIN